MVLQLIVGDPQPLVAAGLAALAESAGHQVAACLHGRDRLPAALAETPAAVALLATALIGDVPGFVALLPAGARIVLLAPDSGYLPPPGLAESILAGVLSKSDGADRFTAALAAIARGESWSDNRREPSGQRPTRRLAGVAALLTPREREIVRLVSVGTRNRAIAEQLGISEGTVKMHLHNVYAKLGVESRTQLATDSRLRALQSAA